MYCLTTHAMIDSCHVFKILSAKLRQTKKQRKRRSHLKANIENS